MSVRWVYLDAPGSRVGESDDFESRESAEDWMGTEWSRLLDGGIVAVVLVDGTEELYTMKLTPE